MTPTRIAQIVIGSVVVMLFVFVMNQLARFLERNEPTTAAKSEVQQLILVGNTARLKSSAIGCATLSEFDKLRELYRARDYEAVRAYVNKSSCEVLPANLVDSVEDGSIMRSAHCLRVRGKPDCLWLPDAMLERTQ